MNILILIVDDEPDVASLFRQHFRRDLRQGRFVMDFAHCGEAALQRLAVKDELSLILVLSDINMPGMTGLELLPRIKALRPGVPVLMVTAYDDPETRRRAAEAGADGLLAKPVDFGGLRREIESRVALAGALS